MKFTDKLIDTFFDRKKLYLIGIFLFGFILRLIAARNLGVSADDVIHAYKAIGIFNSGKLVLWDQSTSLWYYLGGIFYNLFGFSMISSRFAAVLFGSFLIILMYLFVKKVFKSEKVAFIASFLIALSPILIKETLPEMDVAASFFTLFAAYFLLSYSESKQKKDLLLMSLILGLGIMIKLYVAFFAISFLIFLAVIEYKSGKSIPQIIKTIFLVGIILFVLCIPTFTHNYLLFKDKGFMDFIFSNTLNIRTNETQSLYGWAAGWAPQRNDFGFFIGHQKNLDPTPIPGFLVILWTLFRGDPLLFILGFLGLIFVYRTNKKYFWFFLVTFIPAFVYLGMTITMVKHFIWALVLLAPCAALFLESVLQKIPRFRLRHLFLILLIFNLIYLGMPKGISPTNAHFYGESSFGQLVDYAHTIPKEALVIVDSRIYRGNTAFGLAGKNFIEAVPFIDAVQQPNFQTNQQKISVYYVECAIDDCGWGTIKDQPELNNLMESMTKNIINLSISSVSFSAPNPDKFYLPFLGENRTDYRIYKLQLALNPSIFNTAKQTHVWWMYPENYDRTISPIFDDYNTSSPGDELLNNLAKKILYLEIVLSLLTIIYLSYLFVND